MMFTGTAVLLSLLVVAAASPADVTNETASEDKMMEMKIEWLRNFCKGECDKLKCQNFHPVPANGHAQCICISCDMGDVGKLAEPAPETSKDLERQAKPRMRNVMLNQTTTNPTFDGKKLHTGDNHNMTLTNATCNLECRRLDCTYFTANEKIDNCLCHNCDLEVEKSSTGQDSGSNKDKRGSLDSISIWLGCGYWNYTWNYYYRKYMNHWRSCPYKSVLRSRTRSHYTCTRNYTWSWNRYRTRCYYEYYRTYYYASVCDCSANFLIKTCDENAGDTSSPNFGRCSSSNG